MPGKLAAGCERKSAARAGQFFEQVRIRLRRDDDGNVREVLRRRADQRRAADVYLLDGLFERDAFAGHRLLEGVEVDDDHVNRLDAVLFEGAQVFGTLADGEDAAVYARVERLDATVQHFRKAGHVRHVAHFDSGLAQSSRAAGAEELDAEAAQRARELDEAGLVRDAQERPADVPESFGVLFGHKFIRG